MMNVTLVGRVGNDPEIKHFDSGTVKAQISLAVNRRRKDDQPDWFTCEAWGKTAEVIANYVRKGKQIAVRGSLKFDRWNDKTTGAPCERAIISIDEIELLGSKSEVNDSSDTEIALSEADVPY